MTDETEAEPLTWRLAPQIAARAMVAWPIALLPSYFLDLIDEPVPRFENVAFLATVISPLLAWVGTSVGRAERDGSNFWRNLLCWSDLLYLGPLRALIWLIGNIPTAGAWIGAGLEKLLVWVFTTAFWLVLVALLIAAVAFGAYVLVAGAAALPTSAAIVVGAVVIAAAVIWSRKR